MSKDKVKACWDISSTKVFIDLCIEQVKKGARKGTSFTKNGWKDISDGFTASTGKAYDKGQFKNKYDALRKDWQLWDRLIHETGVGWDNDKHTIIADDDWWEKKIAEVQGYEKFRNKGLQFQEELTQLFSNVAATGTHHWAPSSLTLPTNVTPEHDMQEGSGDSDELLGVPTGLSGNINSITFNSASGGSVGNQEKGKEIRGGDKTTIGCRTTSSLGVKRRGDSLKKKLPSSAKIADALSRIADTNDFDAEHSVRMAAEVRAERMAAEARAYEISIAGVMSHLNQEQPSMDNECEIIAEHKKRRSKRVQKIAAYVGSYASLYLCKQPRHTSDYTGAAWVSDVLRGNFVRCYEMFRMELHVFQQLCIELQRHGLRETRQMGIHEMVAIFLNTVGHSVGSRLQQERFQRSGETIHRAVHAVLNACCSLAMSNIKPQDTTFQNIHSKIRLSNRYWPFFKNAIGAIDGTHIPCRVKSREKTKYIGRKGFTSQNVMAVCD